MVWFRRAARQDSRKQASQICLKSSKALWHSHFVFHRRATAGTRGEVSNATAEITSNRRYRSRPEAATFRYGLDKLAERMIFGVSDQPAAIRAATGGEGAGVVFDTVAGVIFSVCARLPGIPSDSAAFRGRPKAQRIVELFDNIETARLFALGFL
jgi:hypothetical protein